MQDRTVTKHTLLDLQKYETLQTVIYVQQNICYRKYINLILEQNSK